MSTFGITFRIHNDDTYSARYTSLIDQIRKEATSEIWEEPTSFALIESGKTTQSLCDALYSNSSILESKDQLLVINLSYKSYAERGCKNKATLKKLMDAR
jgi:hypothetical protein